MAKSINGTVTQTVVLGKHGYGSYLYITTAGVVLPGAGARGVVIPASIQRGEVSNYGQVFGGAGAAGGAGGIALAALGNDLIRNSGSFIGGAGGFAATRAATAGANGRNRCRP